MTQLRAPLQRSCATRKHASLCFSIGTTVCNIAPTRFSDHELINVQYAVTSYTWRKPSKPAALIAQSVSLEQLPCPRGSRNTRKKTKERQRPRVEWFHKLDKFTGEQRDRVQREIALEHPDWATPQQLQRLFPNLYAYVARYAFTAMNMDDDEIPLTSTSAHNSSEHDRWFIAYGEEIARIIEF